MKYDWAAPSLMCLDYLKIAEQVGVISRRAVRGHVDVMDGHFAPNLTLNPYMVRAIRDITALPLDAHLMTTEPAVWIERFAEAGATSISLHAETVWNNAFRMFDKIEALGCEPGLALCPATTIASVKHLLTRVNMLTIMTVDIGYAGSPFIPQMLRKIEEARAFREAEGLSYSIQIDGSCGAKTFRRLHEAGADLYVLGSSLFSRPEAGQSLDAAFDAIADEYQTETERQAT